MFLYSSLKGLRLSQSACFILDAREVIPDKRKKIKQSSDFIWGVGVEPIENSNHYKEKLFPVFSYV